MFLGQFPMQQIPLLNLNLHNVCIIPQSTNTISSRKRSSIIGIYKCVNIYTTSGKNLSFEV